MLAPKHFHIVVIMEFLFPARIYYSCFFTTKPKIDFRKMFKAHLKENEKFPVKVTVFYSIDGSETREVIYSFEVRCFRHFYISPDLAL